MKRGDRGGEDGDLCGGEGIDPVFEARESGKFLSLAVMLRFYHGNNPFPPGALIRGKSA
jgi:hypothetical protein